jgi:hypothetical protein
MSHGKQIKHVNNLSTHGSMSVVITSVHAITVSQISQGTKINMIELIYVNEET